MQLGSATASDSGRAQYDPPQARAKLSSQAPCLVVLVSDMGTLNPSLRVVTPARGYRVGRLPRRGACAAHRAARRAGHVKPAHHSAHVRQDGQRGSSPRPPGCQRTGDWPRTAAGPCINYTNFLSSVFVRETGQDEPHSTFICVAFSVQYKYFENQKDDHDTCNIRTQVVGRGCPSSSTGPISCKRPVPDEA